MNSLGSGAEAIFFRSSPTTSISACISPTFAPEVRHLAQHCLLWEPESISPASTIHFRLLKARKDF